jgi:hypothetical protein
MARACIFCCSNKHLSREDLWPKWLVKFIAQDRPSEIERLSGTQALPFTYRGKWLKARIVCEQCNHGWMSNLENNCKPVLVPLISDTPSSLDYIRQSGIATWTLKTAMAFECVGGAAAIGHDPDAVFYSAEDRRHLLRWNTPPPDTFVWIGRYEPECSIWIQNDRVSNPQPKGVLDEGTVTTLAAGRLILQAITVRRSPFINTDPQSRRIRLGKSSWDSALIPIWPFCNSVVRWPPSLSVVGYDQLEGLARRFGRQRPVAAR